MSSRSDTECYATEVENFYNCYDFRISKKVNLMQNLSLEVLARKTQKTTGFIHDKTREAVHFLREIVRSFTENV